MKCVRCRFLCRRATGQQTTRGGGGGALDTEKYACSAPGPACSLRLQNIGAEMDMTSATAFL